MKANQATHAVGVMCRVLRVSRSGFYAWCDRPMSLRARTDLWLTGKIEAIHRRSRGLYGSPNIHAELADDHGIRVGRKRVARLMRAAGLRGATLRRFVVTTTADPRASRAVDLVDRRFYSDGPDRLWVADISYIPTWVRISVSGDGVGCVFAAHRRLGDGDALEDGADSVGPGDGAGSASTGVRDPSL